MNGQVILLAYYNDADSPQANICIIQMSQNDLTGF
jgi:hypothetical protein